TIAGELAVLRGAALIAAGHATALLAGGGDELDPAVGAGLEEAGGRFAPRGEGAAFVVLESLHVPPAPGARILGEMLGAVSAAFPAPPYGVSRRATSRVIAQALERAAIGADALRAVYAGENGDARRDAWEARVLQRAAVGGVTVYALARQ